MLAWQEAIYTALALLTKVWHSRTRCPRDTPCKHPRILPLGLENEGTFWSTWCDQVTLPPDPKQTVSSERHIELVFLRMLELAMVVNHSLSFYRVCIPH